MADLNAQELQRIYQLKSEGVQAVLADIRAIDDAFRQSAEARAKLAGGSTGYDPDQMAKVNQQLDAMLDIQTEMLSVIKGLNVEFSKGAKAANDMAAGGAKAADSMEDLSNATKSMGNNLGNAAVNLGKVNTIFSQGAGSIGDYNIAMLDLVKKLGLLDEEFAYNQRQIHANQIAYDAGAKSNEAYEATLDSLTVAQSKVTTQMKEIESMMIKLNKTYNPALTGMELPLTQQQINALPENAGNRKADQQLLRTDVEMIKNRSILLNENASYYQKLVAAINTLKISMKLLSTEEVKEGTALGIMQERVAALNAEFDKFATSMGNHQHQVGNYAIAWAGVGNAMQMFGRQLIRGVGSLLIWGVLFDAMDKIKTELLELIPGTEAYEKLQEKLTQANQNLANSFKDLSDGLLKLRDEQYLLYDDGVAIAKNVESEIKAYGTSSGQVYEASVNQKEAIIARMHEEETQLKANKKVLQEYHDLLATGYKLSEEYAGSLPAVGIDTRTTNPMKIIARNTDEREDVRKKIFDQIKDAIQKANLPLEQHTKLMVALDKAYEDGGNLLKIFEGLVRTAASDLTKTSDEIVAKQQEIKNAEIAAEAQKHEIIYSKNVELNNQLLALQREFLQAKEKMEIASLDKVVEQSRRPFIDRIAKIKQDAVQYAKSIMVVDEIYKGTPSADEIKSGAADEDFDAMYKSLPNSVKKKYASSIAAITRIMRATSNNAAEDYLVSRSKQSLQFNQSELQATSGVSAFYAAYGAPSYEKLVKALDDETKAKKHAIEVQFSTQRDAYVANGDDITGLVKLRDAQLQQIEDDSYRHRLELAMHYYTQLESVTNSYYQRHAVETKTYGTERSTNVYKRAGMFTDVEGQLDRINTQTAVALAKNTLNEAGINLHNLQPTLQSASDALEAAKITQNKDEITAAEKAYNDVLAKQAELKQQIADANLVIAKSEYEEKHKHDAILRQAANGFLDIAQAASDAYFQLLEKQDAYRQEMAQRSLAWNQQVMAAEVQSDNERFAQQRANTLATQQLQRDMAIKEKQRAEQQIWINAAIATGKALVESFDSGPAWEAKLAISEAVIFATAAIQESMLSRAPAYASGTGNTTHPGGFAWVGDGGEHELIISPKTPTLVNMAAGSSVIPFSKLPGDLGGSLKAPHFSTPSYSNGTPDMSGMHTMVAQAVHAALSNVSVVVNYDARQAQKSAMVMNYRTRKI